jgi:predicted pyridoxine 5'-phosphate oxidase superfamily flavin-nucleotide-binding protein
MAFIHSNSMGWHEGEQKMHSLMHTPSSEENPTSPFLTPGGAHLLQTAPLLALGTLDREGWPWTALWGGEPGFARSLGSSVVGIKNLVDRQYDPVAQALLGEQEDGEVFRENGQEHFVSGLAIDLSARRRVKFAGHLMAGALGRSATEPAEEDSKTAEAQVVLKINSSLGKMFIH